MDPNATPENPTGLAPEKFNDDDSMPVCGPGIANVAEGSRPIATAPDLTDPDNIKLSDGRVARVKAGKGSLLRAARRIIDGDASMFQSALVALCTTIDGVPITVEDLDEMPLQDALAIEGRFNEKNA